jgi:SOS-response transcriptional repressor LexA
MGVPIPHRGYPQRVKKVIMADWTKEEREAIASRLKQAQIDAGFKKSTEAAARFGWSYAAYSKHVSGQRAMEPKDAAAYAEAFGVTMDYLYFGKIEKNGDNAKAGVISALKAATAPLVKLSSVEYFEKMSAGESVDSAQQITIPVNGAKVKNALFVEAVDRSMTRAGDPRSIEPGSRVHVDLDGQPTPSAIVLALVKAERAAMLRLYREIERTPDGFTVYELVPLNGDFRTIRIAYPGKCVILGTCVDVYDTRSLR